MKYDGTPWKKALRVHLQPFMARFWPEAHAAIDWSRGYQSLDLQLRRFLPAREPGPQREDHLVKVWLAGEPEEWCLAHITVQNCTEADFARRLSVDRFRLFDGLNADVITLAVLGDDDPEWRPTGFNEEYRGCRVSFQFPMVKLLDYGNQREVLEKSSDPFAPVIQAHLSSQQTQQDVEARYAEKLRLTQGLYGRGWAAVDVRRLFRVVDQIMDLPGRREIDFWQRFSSTRHSRRSRS